MDYANLLTRYRKNIIIVSALALVTVMVVLINFSFSSRRRPVIKTSSILPSQINRPSPTIMVRQPPRIKFGQWKTEATPLNVRYRDWETTIYRKRKRSSIS